MVAKKCWKQFLNQSPLGWSSCLKSWSQSLSIHKAVTQYSQCFLVHFHAYKLCFEIPFFQIRIDGGVSNNDFIVQLISTLTGKNIERATSVETSVSGVAFVAGLHSGKTTTLLTLLCYDLVTHTVTSYFVQVSGSPKTTLKDWEKLRKFLSRIWVEDHNSWPSTKHGSRLVFDSSNGIILERAETTLTVANAGNNNQLLHLSHWTIAFCWSSSMF